MRAGIVAARVASNAVRGDVIVEVDSRCSKFVRIGIDTTADCESVLKQKPAPIEWSDVDQLAVFAVDDEEGLRPPATRSASKHHRDGGNGSARTRVHVRERDARRHSERELAAAVPGRKILDETGNLSVDVDPVDAIHVSTE